MIKVFSILILFTFTPFSFSEKLTAEKKLVIDELLEVTGALEVGEMMGASVANQMISMMSRQQGAPDEKVTTILRDEIGKIMHDEFIGNGTMHEISYTIYHKHFTMFELKEMVAFYKTPTGSKMASLMPQVTQEAMIAGEKHGQSLGPIIQQRLKARFEKEGIK